MKRFSIICRLALALFALGTAATASAAWQAPGEIQQRPAKIMRTAWDPSQELYAVIPNFSGISGYGDAYYGKLDVENGSVSRIYRNSVFTNAEEAYVQTGCVRDGVVYIPKMLTNMVTMEVSIIWNRFDLYTGRALEPIEFGGSPDALKMFCYSLTYDPVNDVIYGLTYDNNTGLGGGLIKVDASKPENEWKPVSFYDSNNNIFNVGGTSNDWMAGICFNPMNQTLYGLTSQGTFCEIDPKRCTRVVLREYDQSDEDYCFPPVMQSTPMVYSPYDKAIIFVSFNNNIGNSNICSIDTDEESWDAYYLNDFRTQCMVSTLYCPDPFAEDDAPGVTTTPELSFAPGALSGKISVTAPTNRYDGQPLNASDKLTLYIKSNNKEIFKKEVTPGEKVEFDATMENGLNNIIAYCTLGDLKGPDAKVRLFIGFDQPLAPTNLQYVGGVLTWNTPRNVGVHGAYVDLSDVKYDVFVNGEKHNAAPIEGNSYNIAFNEPANGRKYITVKATSNGLTSDDSQALSRVVGTGYQLPIVITPTEAESTLFETVNLNGGQSRFTFSSEGRNSFNVYTYDYSQKPNDWLFLPPLKFDDPQVAYVMAVNYVNARESELQKDNLEIYIGKDPVPEAMTQMIYSHYGRVQAEPTQIDVKFIVPEAGTYYIGFYCKPGNENVYRGIQLWDFHVGKSNTTTAVPGEPTNVKITPFPDGGLAFNIEATFPTLNMAGNPLAADEELTMVFANESDSVQFTGKPGETVNGTLNVSSDGICDIYSSVSNAEGPGQKTFYSAYAGIDTPLPPTNVRYVIDDDNLGMVVSWDPVSEVGQHGGFVDVNEVIYDFYTQSSTDATKLGTAGKQCSYHFQIGAGAQGRYYVGPVATNEMGMSTNGVFITETLGNPYITPVKEDFGYSAFRLTKWLYDTSAPYKGVTWEHCTEPDPSFATEISFTNGGSFRATGNGVGQLMAPRISTINDDILAFKTRYWNYARAGKIEIWGRTNENQEFVKVAEVDPTRPEVGQWEDWLVPLPSEFARKQWIQLNVRAVLSGGQNVLLDTYEVTQNVSTDLQASSISVPYSAFIGEEPEFNVVVTNAGNEPSRGHLVVELLGDGEVLASTSTDIERLRAGENFEFPVSFPLLENYINYDMLEVHAYAEAEDDQNPRNNDCYNTFLHLDSTFPIVRDLTAARSDDGQSVNLNWSEPKSFSDGLESAENYCPFVITEKIGPWTNVDIDGREPFAISNNVRWSDDSKPCAWVVFDADEMSTLDDARLSPHTGKQMLLARSGAYDVESEKPVRSMDFLISPEVKGGSKVGFWINTLSSSYTETVAIWYSSTDIILDPSEVVLTEQNVVPRTCGSFKWLRNFTKSGSEAWEYCEVTLPADAKYFAFVYSSFGQFGATIDDITYQPVNPVTLTPDNYEVLASYDDQEPRLIAGEVTGTSYKVNKADGRATTYYVRGNFENGDRIFEAPLSNGAHVEATGIADLEAGQYVRGGKGVIVIGGADGSDCSIVDLSGKFLGSRKVNSNREVINVEPGIYIVTLGRYSVKVLVK